MELEGPKAGKAANNRIQKKSRKSNVTEEVGNQESTADKYRPLI